LLSHSIREDHFSFEVKFLVERVSQKWKALCLPQKLNSSCLETLIVTGIQYFIFDYSKSFAAREMTGVLQDLKTGFILLSNIV
jgi:hypothetical protein